MSCKAGGTTCDAIGQGVVGVLTEVDTGVDVLTCTGARVEEKVAGSGIAVLIPSFVAQWADRAQLAIFALNGGFQLGIGYHTAVIESQQRGM